jgi:hypothetical protein
MWMMLSCFSCNELSATTNANQIWMATTKAIGKPTQKISPFQHAAMQEVRILSINEIKNPRLRAIC